MEDKEKCLLVGVQLTGDTEDNDMVELEQLVEAAEGEAVASVVQNRHSIDNRYYVGEGKLMEIAAYVDELCISTVVFNDELSGSQIKNIEDVVDAKIIDRTGLILDIFARRALTREGQLQVELAQLKYSLPRLVGMGKNMSRLGGGIGTRGPGEKKIETDRRRIRDKITEIERELSAIGKVRDTKRKKRMRDEIPIVSIVGYTNAGKSTLLNALIETQYEGQKLEDKKVFSHDMLFATLDTELRQVRLPGGRKAVFSDTVGFIKKLPTQIVEAFKGTLEEIRYADIIIHLIDINDENIIAHKETTTELIEKIAGSDIPVITVYNKVDRMLKGNMTTASSRDIVYISAKDGYNLDKLKEVVDSRLNGGKVSCHMEISGDCLGDYYYLYENRNISDAKFDGDGVSLNVVLYEDEVNKYSKYIKEVYGHVEL